MTGVHGRALVTDTRVVSWLMMDCTQAPCHDGVRVKLYIQTHQDMRWG